LRAAEPGRPALICEDDLNFSRDFLHRIEGIVEHLRRNE
jgi:GR25 family glycosyltransferase involved in LPS biosynthesis